MKRGITLISLVITIIIILILAGVGISGSLALIEQAKFTAQANDLQQKAEVFEIYVLEKQLEGAGSTVNLYEGMEEVQSESELPKSLQDEIKYARELVAGNVDVENDIPSDFADDTLEIGEEGKNIYYLPGELTEGKHQAYIYDEQSASVYKVEATIIWGVAMHGYDYGNLLVSRPGLLERAQGKGTQVEVDYQMISKLEDGTYIIELIITSSAEIGNIQIEGIEDTTVATNGKEATVQFNGSENTQYKVNITMANKEKISKTVDIEGHKTLIRSVAELEAFREHVNSGNTYEGVVVELKEDLNLSEIYGQGLQSWTPIANYGVDATTSTLTFKGTFEGNNHKISNLYISGATTEGQGLFGKNAGTIQNLTLENININVSSKYTGGLVGYNDTTGIISNIKTTGTVNITGNYTGTGGIVGLNYGVITKGANYAVITGRENVGGIVGECYSGIISESFNMGDVTASSIKSAGICGRLGNNSSILYCFNVGVIKSNGYSGSLSHCGGIAAGADYGAKIEWCYSRGQVSGYKSSGVGLIAGVINYYENNVTVRNSYATPLSTFKIVGYNYRWRNNNRK